MEQPKFSNQHATLVDWLCAALVFVLALIGCFAFLIVETLAYLSWPIPLWTCGVWPFGLPPCF